MYQLKIKEKTYCAETIYSKNGSHSTISFGRCKKIKACKDTCGTLKKKRKNRPYRLFLRKLRSLF